MARAPSEIDPNKALEEANRRIDDILKEGIDFEDLSGRTPLHAALSNRRYLRLKNEGALEIK